MNVKDMLLLYAPASADGGDAGGDNGNAGDQQLYVDHADNAADDVSGGDGDESTDATDAFAADGADCNEVDSDDADGDGATEVGAAKSSKAKPDSQRQQTIALDQKSIEALTRASAQPKSEQKPLTPEEIGRLTQKFVVTADTLKGLGFDEASPEQVKGFQTFADGVAKHAITMSRLMLERAIAQNEQTMAPIIGHMQSVRAERAEASFYGAYPGLKQYGSIVKAVARDLAQSAEMQGKDERTVFRAVASAAAKQLTDLGIKVNLKATHNSGDGQRQAVTQVPPPNVVRSPGRSGGQGGGNQQVNPDADIYSGR